MTISELYARLKIDLPERGRRKHRDGVPVLVVIEKSKAAWA